MWQELLKNKYLRTQTTMQVEHKPGDSHFWASLMKTKNTFLSLGTFQLNCGTQIRFWEDIWVGNSTLKVQYPSLYNIARKKHATVSSVFDRVPLNVTFRRSLQGQNLILWYELVNKIANVQLNDNKNRFRWNITSNGLFTVQSMYRSLLNNNAISGHRVIWQIKVPLKIKVFLWYLSKGVTLTKDNLAKRNWNGSKLCSFCGHNETIQHLFFDC